MKPDNSQHGEGCGREAAPLAGELLAIDCCWRRAGSFLQGCGKGSCPCSSRCTKPARGAALSGLSSRTATQIEAHEVEEEKHVVCVVEKGL